MDGGDIDDVPVTPQRGNVFSSRFGRRNTAVESKRYHHVDLDTALPGRNPSELSKLFGKTRRSRNGNANRSKYSSMGSNPPECLDVEEAGVEGKWKINRSIRESIHHAMAAPLYYPEPPPMSTCPPHPAMTPISTPTASLGQPKMSALSEMLRQKRVLSTKRHSGCRSPVDALLPAATSFEHGAFGKLIFKKSLSGGQIANRAKKAIATNATAGGEKRLSRRVSMERARRSAATPPPPQSAAFLRKFASLLRSTKRRRSAPLNKRGVRREWLVEVFIRAGKKSESLPSFKETKANSKAWALKGLAKTRRSIDKFNAASFVDLVVRPLTAKYECCLWDLIPTEHVSEPDAFVSYSWQYPLGDLLEACTSARFVWIDFVAVSQHAGTRSNIEDVSGIGACVASIGHTLLCLDTRGYALSRAWVLYEIVQSTYLEIIFFGRTGRSYGSNSTLLLSAASEEDAKVLDGARVRAEAGNYALEVFDSCLGGGNFKSRSIRTDKAKASIESDRDMITHLVCTRFGSNRKADSYIMKLILESLLAFVRAKGFEEEDAEWLVDAQKKFLAR